MQPFKKIPSKAQVHEKELIQSCLQNEPRAQRELFHSYAPAMLSICMRYSRNQDEAKDMMQEGFVKVLLSLSKFKGDSALSTWMTRIMINTSIDYYNKHYKKKVFVDIDDVPEAAEETQEEDFMNSIPEEKIISAIQELSEGYRMVFNLYAIEDYSHKEIASALGISEGTSKSQLARARKILQEKLKFIYKKQSLAGEQTSIR